MSSIQNRRLPLVVAAVLTLGWCLSAGAQEAAEGDPAQDETTRVEVPVDDGTSMTVRVEHKRVPLPSLSTSEDHPFTIEIPATWGPRRDLAAPGVFLGPPSGDPNSRPEMLLVRESDVALEAPAAILSNLRIHAQQADWSLREAEVQDFGGVEGLWIVREMAPSGFHGSRLSFAVKLPLGDRSLDVLATIPAEQSAALTPQVESMLRSIRPAEAAPAAPEP